MATGKKRKTRDGGIRLAGCAAVLRDEEHSNKSRRFWRRTVKSPKASGRKNIERWKPRLTFPANGFIIELSPPCSYAKGVDFHACTSTAPGEIIGLASPSCLVTPEWAAPIVSALESMGYAVKLPPNLYARGWGYAASPEQRAADFNALIADPTVRLVFFGGGEGADDLLPLLDYDAARANPKLYLSYSDGTSILNAPLGEGRHRHLLRPDARRISEHLALRSGAI